MYDLVIKNGVIYDGSGNGCYKTDIGIIKGKIVKISSLKNDQSYNEIDASGLGIMPGFIDTHVHSDMILLYDRQHSNGLCQGITTEILGQDGLSYVPLSPDKLKDYAKYLGGLNGYFDDIQLDFRNVNEYLNKFDKKTAINVAYLITHGAIRLEAAGFNDVPLKGNILIKAKELMRESFEQGAVGFSTGLSYWPHFYSDTDELVELCKVCAEYNAVFVIHLRTVFRDKPFNAVDEAIEIARRSGVRIHFSHFKTTETNSGKSRELLEPIEKAISEGIKVSLELYPYYAGAATVILFLPPWIQEGGSEKILERLKDSSLRKKIINGIKENEFYSQIPRAVFTHLKKNESYVGRDFSYVAKKRNQSVEEMLCDILVEEDLEAGFLQKPTEDIEKKEQMKEDMIWLLSKPNYMIGSDMISVGLKPHPRAFGTFPRFLRLAKQYGMSYENFANRTSFLPATVFKLKNRGKIAKDYYADIVIFNPETVRDNATYKNPRRPPEGIEYVIVNGEVAVYKEKVTGLFRGHSIKREN